MEKIMTDGQREKLSALLDACERVVVTCHQNPDGDAIGSITALAQMLHRQGKHVTMVAPNDFPDFLKWIPLATDIVAFDRNASESVFSDAELVFCLDYNGPSRVGDAMQNAMNKCLAPKVMIDHHLDPDEGFCQVVVSRPYMCSACEVLLCVAQEMGWAEGMTADEATSLYVGMMTDTGAFTYNSSRPEVYEAISLLLRTGIDKDRIYRRIFWVSTPDRMRLMGYMLYVKMELLEEGRASLMTLDRQERRLFQLKNGDTEGFVNLPLEIKGTKLSVFLREDTEQKDMIRVSLRSVDDFPCNQMAAEFFNGGGHLNASGGRVQGTMDEAIALVRQAVRKYAPLLK